LDVPEERTLEINTNCHKYPWRRGGGKREKKGGLGGGEPANTGENNFERGSRSKYLKLGKRGSWEEGGDRRLRKNLVKKKREKSHN